MIEVNFRIRGLRFGVSQTGKWLNNSSASRAGEKCM